MPCSDCAKKREQERQAARAARKAEEEARAAERAPIRRVRVNFRHLSDRRGSP